MSLREAQDWYNLLSGDATEHYISPNDTKNAVRQTYLDVADFVQVGDGINGEKGSLYTPDPSTIPGLLPTSSTTWDELNTVWPLPFTGLSPAGWRKLGAVGGVVWSGPMAVGQGDTTKSVTHGLNQSTVSITLLDSGGSVVHADAHVIDANSVGFNFGAGLAVAETFTVIVRGI
jgi:hypothetical protein